MITLQGFDEINGLHNAESSQRQKTASICPDKPYGYIRVYPQEYRAFKGNFEAFRGMQQFERGKHLDL